MTRHEILVAFRCIFITMFGWLLMIIVSICSLHSCARVQYVPVETIITDSVTIRDTMMQVQLVPYKDSLVTRVTADSAASFLSNDYAYSWARYHGGNLYHSLGIWPNAQTQISVPYFIDRVRRIEVPKPYPVEPEHTWWENIKLSLGGVAIVLHLLYLAALITYIVCWYIRARKRY